MKLLYLLKSIFKDWFTKDIKYTLLMILIMFLSVLSLYISTFVIGSDSFPSIETEKRRERTYVLDTGFWHPLNIEKLNYVLNDIKMDDNLFPNLSEDEYVGAEQVFCQFIIDKVNGVKKSNEKIEKAYPLFEEANNNIQSFVDKSMGYSYENVLKAYPNFCEGDYILVPKNSAYKKGDIISCLDTDLTVLGASEYECYVISFVLFKEYLDNHGYTAQGIFINSYVFENRLTDNQITILSQKLYPEGDILLHNLGPSSTDIAIFIMAELVICGITAIFCVFSMLSVIRALLEKTTPMLEIFRILGAKRGMIIFLIYFQLVVCFIISFFIAFALLPLISYGMSKINVLCEIRTKYTIIVFVISMISIMFGNRKIIVRTAEKKLV